MSPFVRGYAHCLMVAGLTKEAVAMLHPKGGWIRAAEEFVAKPGFVQGKVPGRYREGEVFRAFEKHLRDPRTETAQALQKLPPPAAPPTSRALGSSAMTAPRHALSSNARASAGIYG